MRKTIFLLFIINTLISCKTESTCELEQFDRDLLLQIEIRDINTNENLLPNYNGGPIVLSILSPIPPDPTPVEPNEYYRWESITDTSTVLYYLFDSDRICGSAVNFPFQLSLGDSLTYDINVDLDSKIDENGSCSDCEIDFIESISIEGFTRFFDYGGDRDRVVTIEL